MSSWISRRIRHEQIEQGRPGGFWDRASRAVMARPVISLVLSASFLIVLSLPFWLQAHPNDDGRGIKQGLSGTTTLPDDIQTKQAFLALVEYFPKAGANAPAQLAILGSPDDPEVQQGIETLTAEIADDPNLGAPLEPRASEDGSVTLVEIPLTGEATDTQSEAAVLAIRELRETYVPEAFGGSGVRVLVGGETAFITDFFDVSSDYTPLIIVIVLEPVVHPADGGVPVARGSRQGDRDEPALRRSGVRRDRPGVPEGRSRRSARRSRTHSGSNRPTRSRRGSPCSCSRSCSVCRWTTTCSS